MILIDTNIAIEVLDEHVETVSRIMDLEQRLYVPLMVWVELEQGIGRDAARAALRRRLLDRMLESFPPILFEPEDIRRYGGIVGALGYSRPKAADRLIAAQCLVRNASLVTRNARDFQDIEGLRLIQW